MESLTEVELFLSDHPLLLIQNLSSLELTDRFGPISDLEDPQFKSLLLDQIWTKYRRIDLIKWDLQEEGLFFDYVQQKPISLSQFREDFEKYSPLARKKLRVQLERSLDRWIEEADPDLVQQVINLINQIKQAESKLLGSEYVLDPVYD